MVVNDHIVAHFVLRQHIASWKKNFSFRQSQKLNYKLELDYNLSQLSQPNRVL